ncbi:MAG: alkaline phosphatase family protein [Candidatus Omnitrophica bacterium]|nr:alkaline phosphatase family protein [Candidatus Omnitrophota bacterium]
MPRATVVINVVGLSSSLFGERTPNLNRFIGEEYLRRIEPVLPAVTCSVQSSMVTGLHPREHGIVGNGWYNREMAEIQFWKQSNHLVKGEKVWEAARNRDSSVTCSKMFWWYNMYSSTDYSVTPRPIYKADGRKLPDCYSHPSELRDRLQAELGTFPLFKFWGPAASIESSKWIAEASMKVHEWKNPTLTLIYLPHLDYGLQKLGPDHPEIPNAVAEIDEVVGKLIDFYRDRGVRILILSEYGIESVNRPIEVNRALRRAGLIHIREEEGHELLDAGASRAFAVADHQVAHVYVKSPNHLDAAREVLGGLAGVAQCLDRDEQNELGIDHQRSGDLVLVAEKGAWFNYHYWLDDRRAPDFARTVDIHRKPGYDPLELYVDPEISLPWLKIGGYLLKKKLGLRGLLEVIPLDPSLLKGSHGRAIENPELHPVLIGDKEILPPKDAVHCTEIKEIVLKSLFGEA